MKATAILAVIAATAASPSLGEQLAETFVGEWTSVGELEITPRISLVAVCCSRDSVSAWLRACTSSKSRAFSIAISA